jgi:hypothetical protein
MTCTSPPAGPFVSMLGDQFDAGDVENLAASIQTAANFYLLTLVLFHSVLVVKLIRAIVRYFQHVPSAVLYDRSHQSQHCRRLSGRIRLLLVRLRYRRIRRRQRLRRRLRFLKLRPCDELPTQNAGRKRRARLGLRILRKHERQAHE